MATDGGGRLPARPASRPRVVEVREETSLGLDLVPGVAVQEHAAAAGLGPAGVRALQAAEPATTPCRRAVADHRGSSVARGPVPKGRAQRLPRASPPRCSRQLTRDVRSLSSHEVQNSRDLRSPASRGVPRTPLTGHRHRPLRHAGASTSPTPTAKYRLGPPILRAVRRPEGSLTGRSRARLGATPSPPKRNDASSGAQVLTAALPDSQEE